MDNSSNTFDNQNQYEHNTTLDVNFRYMIPKGTKTIEIIAEIENIAGVDIFYTKSGRSFAEHQLDGVEVTYNYIMKTWPEVDA